ncbi:hypothetical protein COB64_00610 [Candidatus Wolfebacteria bacterium]|nr:MAG: hypothetical protein COB64_00610 [Candidatus Wolfebacteria bacterium]
MEEIRLGGKEEKPKSSIEEQANSQEHPTLLLLERVENLDIFNQMVELYLAYYISENHPDKEDINKLRNKIEEAIKHQIKEVSIDTPLSFDPNRPVYGFPGFDLLHISESKDPVSREAVATNIISPHIDPDKRIIAQSILEAHEKGHIIRVYSNKYFMKHFASAFDQDAMQFDITEIRKAHNKKHDEVLVEILKEYLFSATEVVERMSQLKSYFGMKGNEEFTKEHFIYAKEYYVKDTGLDNHMTQFMSTVTSDTLDEFIRLINSSGI